MRKLAIWAFSFSAAVFGAAYLLPEGAVLPAGFGAALLGIALWIVFPRCRGRIRSALILCCAGAAAGLLWTAVYTAAFFQPARELDGRTVMIEAAVEDWPQGEEGRYSVVVRVDTESSFVKLTAILYTDEQGAALQPGDRISTVAHCTLGDRTFSGEEITYYTAKGIFLRAQSYGRLESRRPEHIPPRCWTAVLSKDLKESIDQAFPPDAAALIRALTTGNKDNLTDEYTSSLERTGLSHTVAVSGMHLAFLASLLSLLLGKGKRSTALVTILGTALFCGVAGNTPSVLRAAVMILLLQLAPLFGRERDDATALGLALMLLLAWNPFSAAHIGLQFSFGSVAGILLVSGRIQDWLTSRLRLDRRPKRWLFRQLIRVPRFLVSTLSATLGASVLTIPLGMLYFQTFSLISPISNLVTLWAVAVLFLGGLCVGILGIFLPAPAAVLAIPFTGLSRFLEWIVNCLGRHPLAAITMDSVYYRAWAVYFCILVGLTLGTKGKKRPVLPVCAGAVTLALSLLFTAWTFQSGSLTAVVLDVGQGQSVLIRAGRFLTLVDCGGDGPDSAGDVAADYIQSLGRSTLDLLVVSHYHADHANGIPQLLRRVDVSNLALPDVEEDDPLRQEILDAAEEQGIQVWFIREDRQISLESGEALTIYAPLGSGTDTNELGLTVLATAGDFDVLVTGDMTGEVEELLLAHTRLPDIELLVVGHHGSKYSTTQELLTAARPEVAVISVGGNNRYGHPTQETLDRLDEAGAEIYRTDLYGTVEIHANG